MKHSKHTKTVYSRGAVKKSKTNKTKVTKRRTAKRGKKTLLKQKRW